MKQLKKKAKLVYCLKEDEKDEQGTYIPCIVQENKKGYLKIDINLGFEGRNKEKAEALIKTKNAILGITEEEASKIIKKALK